MAVRHSLSAIQILIGAYRIWSSLPEKGSHVAGQYNASRRFSSSRVRRVFRVRIFPFFPVASVTVHRDLVLLSIDELAIPRINALYSAVLKVFLNVCLVLSHLYLTSR